MGLFRKKTNNNEHVTHIGVHDATEKEPLPGGRVDRLHSGKNGNGKSPKETKEPGAPLSEPLQPIEKTRVIVIANQKGGVGKTTTTVNLGAYLAVMGRKVLIVDLDPQGNATSGLGISQDSLETSVYEVLMKKADIESVIMPTGIEHLYIAPASFALADAQVELVSVISRETRLRDVLKPLNGEYHYIIIDCPPSMGLLTVNALTAAEELIIPVQCEYFALEGLAQLLDSIDDIKQYLNPQLGAPNILMTMYDARTKLAQEVVQEVRTHYPNQVHLTVIPRSVRLSEAPSYGQPIVHYDALSRGAIAYKELAEEVMRHG
jgi:chromosome partitioning protein